VEPVDKTAASGRTAVLAQIQATVPDARAARWLSAYFTLWFGLLSGQIRRLIAQTLLSVLVLMPAVGKVASLMALGRNRATHATYVLAWIGLGASAAGVLIPVLVTTFVLYRPLFMVGLVLRSLKQIQTESGSAPGGEPEPTDPPRSGTS
jgi:hypothetical protein